MGSFAFALLAVILAVASAATSDCSTKCDSMKLDVLTLAMCR